MTGTKIVKLNLEGGANVKLPSLRETAVDHKAVEKAIRIYEETKSPMIDGFIPTEGQKLQELEEEYYQKIMKATKGLNVNSDQLQEVVDYLQADFGREMRYTQNGYFLTALIRHSKFSEFTIRPKEHLHDVGFRLNADKTIIIEGNVGGGVGTEMEAGTIIIKGDAGSYTGYGMKGGRIHILGNAEDGTAARMEAGDIIVEGNSGKNTGEHMHGGSLEVGGSAGDYTALGMEAGKIYIKRNSGVETAYSMAGGTLKVDGRIKDISVMYEAGTIIEAGTQVRPL
ncbi:MAG: hypothetical protein V1921_06380 [Candidatus Altiarchaeota archaeon]